MISSDEIMDILIKNQEPVKTGSDGEYYSEMALMSENFRIVANEISFLTSPKQVTDAVEFAEWLRENKWKGVAASEFWHKKMFDHVAVETSAILYEYFKKGGNK